MATVYKNIKGLNQENIVDSGTEGTKVAVGTTAQRGSTTGQWRFNSTTGYFEGRNSGGSFSTLQPTPVVTSVDDGEVDSAAGGNQTIVITGEGFASGDTASFVGSTATFDASTTTVDSATQITAVAPKSSFLNAQEPYKVKVTASSGMAGVSATGLINVDNAPTWTTNAGSLGTIASNDTGNHFTVAATDAEGDTVAYSLVSGALQGLSLNSSTGVISGDPTDVTSNTTVSFTLRATAGGKTSDRAFSFILTPNVATFNYTGSNQTFTPPNSVTSFLIYMWGAGGQGGSSNGTARNGGAGGAGGYVAGTVSNYSAGTTFSILVGQGNNSANGNTDIMQYGGGGAGTDNNGGQGAGGHGGGRSELSIGGGSNTPAGTRILVAGGGGGGGAFYHNGESNSNNDGGDAAYSSGQSGNGTGTVPTGGSGSAGGSAGSGATGGHGNSPTAGSAGIGGRSRGGNQNIDIGYGRPAGGGGGYYGGGGGDGGANTAASQGGGGGSSYYNSSYVSNFANATGTQTTAPENSNTYYSSGIAVGGTGTNGSTRANSLGGNGKVVIVY